MSTAHVLHKACVSVHNKEFIKCFEKDETIDEIRSKHSECCKKCSFSNLSPFHLLSILCLLSLTHFLRKQVFLLFISESECLLSPFAEYLLYAAVFVQSRSSTKLPFSHPTLKCNQTPQIPLGLSPQVDFRNAAEDHKGQPLSGAWPRRR